MQPTPLSTSEVEQLADCEHIIEAGVNSGVNLEAALAAADRQMKQKARRQCPRSSSNRDAILAAHPLAPWLESRGVKLSANKTRAARCPLKAHSRRDNVSLDTEKNLWHCHACGKGGTVIDWLMLEKDMTAAEAIRELGGTNHDDRRQSQQRKRVVAEYSYTDEAGNLLFQCVRFEPKGFFQRQPDGKGGWTWNLDGVRLVPYNLPAVLNAKEVWIVEGEKDADNLGELGFTATCNPMGAGKWRDAYSQHFKNKAVFIVPDNDEAGLAHAEQVARSLHGVAASIKIVRLPR